MIGIFSKTTDSNIIESIAYTALDFVILDMEHGPNNLITIHNHVRALNHYKTKSIVRVKSCDHNEIGSVLDAGADGVQVPNISSIELAKQAINAARYFPSGNRGVCRYVKDARFGDNQPKEYFEKANKKTLILQVEGKDGIAVLDDIIDLKGYDILFIGPNDLSQSLGMPGQVTHPKIYKLCEELSNKTKRKGLRLGIFVDNLDQAAIYKRLGFEYIAYSVDISIFRQSVDSLAIEFNKIKKQ